MIEKRNIPISTPSAGEEEWQALREPLMTGWLTQRPKVAAFEQAFAKRHQVKHAIATTSCTTALHLILIALGIGEGDEVIVRSRCGNKRCTSLCYGSRSTCQNYWLDERLWGCVRV